MSLYVFTQNEKEFSQKLNEFQNFYSQYAISSKKTILKEQMKLSLAQAESQLKFMDIETNACNPSTKQELQPKLRTYKVQYSDAQKKLKEIQLGVTDMVQSAPQQNQYGQSKLVQMNYSMQNQVNQLEDLDKMLNQTEDTSNNIVESLKQQKDKLKQAIEDTNQINTDLQRTNRQVGMMKNRETYNKAILLSLICILTIGNCLIIYYKFS